MALSKWKAQLEREQRLKSFTGITNLFTFSNSYWSRALKANRISIIGIILMEKGTHPFK